MFNHNRKSVQTICLIFSVIFFIIYLYSEFILSGYISGITRMIFLIIGCVLMSIYSYYTYNRITKGLYILFFVLYITFLVDLTLFDSLYGRKISILLFKDIEEILYYLQRKTNFVPFSTLMLYIEGYTYSNVALTSLLTNLLGNFVAFMPFGLFYPILFTELKKPSKYLIAITLTVIFIESAQLILMTGAFDVDDIILNVAGSFTAFLLCKRFLFSKIKF